MDIRVPRRHWKLHEDAFGFLKWPDVFVNMLANVRYVYVIDDYVDLAKFAQLNPSYCLGNKSSQIVAAYLNLLVMITLHIVLWFS